MVLLDEMWRVLVGDPLITYPEMAQELGVPVEDVERFFHLIPSQVRLNATLKALRSKPVIKAEEISQIVGVTVRTVYRHVGYLRKRGYKISGSAGVGYSFGAAPPARPVAPRRPPAPPPAPSTGRGRSARPAPLPVAAHGHTGPALVRVQTTEGKWIWTLKA